MRDERRGSQDRFERVVFNLITAVLYLVIFFVHQSVGCGVFSSFEARYRLIEIRYHGEGVI